MQILSWVLSYDGVHMPEPLAITAAGAALAISGMRITFVIATVVEHSLQLTLTSSLARLVCS